MGWGRVSVSAWPGEAITMRSIRIQFTGPLCTKMLCRMIGIKCILHGSKTSFGECHDHQGYVLQLYIWDVGKIEAARLNLLTEGCTYCEVINKGKTSQLGNKVLKEGYKKVDQVPCPQSSGGFSSTPVLSFLSSINAQWPTSVFNDSQSQPTGIMDIGYSLWTKSSHLLKNPL